MPGTASVFNGSISIAAARQTAAALGKYFVATNPTPGTGIVCGTVVAFSATADGLFTISNSNQVNGANIQLDYLSLNMSGTAPTATTVMKMSAYLESGIVAPSGGSSVVTPRNVLPSGAASLATVNAFAAGMATIPAAVGTRTLAGNWSIPTSLGITGDTYVTFFGGQSDGGNALTAARATAPARIVAHTTPITIPPQYTAILDWWWIGQATNGPTFEYELAWFEM